MGAVVKIYLDPNPGKRPDKCDGGIRRVLDAQIKYLPEFGVEVTTQIDEADLTVGHVDHAPIVKGKPFISSCHGLMWSEYFNEAYNQQVNESVVNALVMADAITAPSNWVAHALTRGILKTPHVIYHGVDAKAWRNTYTSAGYVLWNKARADAVSNPNDMQKVAALMLKTDFVSTLGKAQPNVKIVGTQKYDAHKKFIQQAGVYLATARETFGIGTLEAMASGVPVAGWDYGGQSEIIQQGETGYLAPYGDYPKLAEAIEHCLSERERLSANCITDIAARWGWLDKIEQYAALYKCVLHQWTDPRPKVSIIVTCHNLAGYLPDALNSVKTQTLKDWECLIVDDDSKDESPSIAQSYCKNDKRFVYLRTPENLKLSRALNYGHARARGQYVMNLDGDNMLPNNALEILAGELDKRRDLSVVYGGLDTVSDDGSNRQPNEFPYPTFTWYGQMAHQNQLHSSAMARRGMIQNLGGYRERQWRAEDAELWCRASSFGYRIARVTDKPTLIYRWRKDSKSMIEGRENQDRDGDWTEYFGWATAHSANDGRKVIQENAQAVKNPHLVPFGAQGKRIDKLFWDVSHRQEPLVSVIIPVGPKHKRYVIDALDSLVGQLTDEWEAIVINDSGDDWDSIDGAPWARVFKTKGKQGAGAAKNLGLTKARAPFVFFLDADDMLTPDALIKMLRRYAIGDAAYIYCDVRMPTNDKQTEFRVVKAEEYSAEGFLHRGMHAQAVLMATDHARQVGGFNESMLAWEDWDFFVKCAVAGINGERIAEPLLTYRKDLGGRSGIGYEKKGELFNELRERYADYTTGAKKMCQGCGAAKAAMDRLQQSRTVRTAVESLDKPVPNGMTRMKYIGAYKNPVGYHANGREYRAANTDKWRFLDVLNEDVKKLEDTGVFKRAPVPAPIPEAPKPIVIAPTPTPAPIPAPVAPPTLPVVSAEQMQAAIAEMEKQTGHKIQPATNPRVIPMVETQSTTAANTTTVIVSRNIPTTKSDASVVVAPDAPHVEIELVKTEPKKKRGRKPKVKAEAAANA